MMMLPCLVCWLRLVDVVGVAEAVTVVMVVVVVVVVGGGWWPGVAVTMVVVVLTVEGGWSFGGRCGEHVCPMARRQIGSSEPR